MINEEYLKEWLREYIVQADRLKDIVIRTIYEDGDCINKQELQDKKELVEQYNEVRERILDVIPNIVYPILYPIQAVAKLTGICIDYNDEYDFVLIDIGPNRIMVIKYLRDNFGFCLDKIKKIENNLPVILCVANEFDAKKNSIDVWSKELRGLGAITAIRVFHNNERENKKGHFYDVSN
jgi:hypothetical protein